MLFNKSKNQRKKSKIEHLKESLYSKNFNISRKRPKLSVKNYNVKTDWGTEAMTKTKTKTKTKKQKTVLEKMLIIAIIFLFLSIGTALLIVLGGANKISSDNVSIEVLGPVSVESGGRFTMQIIINNNNPTDLELADLIVKYPNGTRSIDNNKSLTVFRKSLGVIPAGGTDQEKVDAVLYGEENNQQNIIISLEYRVAGSNAIFFKYIKYEINISSSPVNLIVSPISEAISGQEVELSVSVLSNSENPVEDLLLKAEYPFGFKFKEASPKPTYGDNLWKLKDLNKDEGKDIIKIKGVITGQNEEERVFKFISGTGNNENKKEIESIFASTVKSIIIKKPFMGIKVALNGDISPEYVSANGRPVRVDIVWVNNSPFKIIDGEIRVKLKGQAINKFDISTDTGFYRSLDNVIIWNKNTNGELFEINQGDSGHLSFSFVPSSLVSDVLVVNPKIYIDVSVKGNRLSENNIPEEIDSSVTKVIKLYSNLSVTPRATYYTGPFTNSGAIPPEVDKETTYTVTWTVTNTSNDLSGVKVVSALPAYVRWLGVVSPKSETISYNPVGGEIVWDVGDVKAGTGITSPVKEISFQIALLPSLSQIGTSPDLTRKTVITGKDTFTDGLLKNTRKSINTKLSTDPGLSEQDGIVIQGN